ncbi:sigma-70 family RNA polymerase sigma factor [uncultured Enterococcus sp.]|uniref:sigma-70 family RNA polymerase sigma factor n=1 Tax=uncultured Enterococcus sp. TaxID=167972 RepID=UPI0025D71B7D|nr:sigma-70 family RNA polymerase sigma factor [uncultured Enterococcus sp.]
MTDSEQFEQTENDQLFQLFRQYFPVILAMRKKYYIKGFDEDDWAQEGYISLYKAKCAYDPSKGASFGSFFKRTFENNIKSQLRKQNAYKRQTDQLATSLEEHTYRVSNEATSLYPNVIYEDSLNRLLIIEALNGCIDDLPYVTQQVLLKTLEGKELSDIASELNLPARTVRYQVNKIKMKISLLLY